MTDHRERVGSTAGLAVEKERTAPPPGRLTKAGLALGSDAQGHGGTRSSRRGPSSVATSAPTSLPR